MALTKRERKTIDYYDTHTREWIDQRRPEAPSGWQAQLERFNELLPSGRIIEIGSGSGREAFKLIELGYEYTGTDASEGLIKESQDSIPNGQFFHKTVYDLDFPKESFDGFWTAATLLHIPKIRILEALGKIKKIVRKGGVGFISLKEGEGEVVEKKTGRLFSYYSVDEFSDILSRSQMELIEAGSRIGSDGTRWITFFVRII